jgi:hypothetical protein
MTRKGFNKRLRLCYYLVTDFELGNNMIIFMDIFIDRF